MRDGERERGKEENRKRGRGEREIGRDRGKEGKRAGEGERERGGRARTKHQLSYVLEK